MPKNVIILAGPNGAGKTSFANQYVHISSYQYLSADAIAEKLAPQPFNEVKVKAGREFFKQITDMITENQDIVVESTLSGLGFQRIIHRFHQAGYLIHDYRLKKI